MRTDVNVTVAAASASNTVTALSNLLSDADAATQFLANANTGDYVITVTAIVSSPKWV